MLLTNFHVPLVFRSPSAIRSNEGGLAAQFTGEPAEEVVEGLPDVSESLVGTHKNAGKIATVIASITTVIGIVIGFVGGHNSLNAKPQATVIHNVRRRLWLVVKRKDLCIRTLAHLNAQFS